MDYTSKQVRRSLERYQEIRSTVELGTTNYSPVKSKGGSQQKSSDTLCLLVDLDNALNSLTPRQHVIVGMVKEGYVFEDIQKKLAISVPTVKFHFNSAIFRILTYLNA